MLTIRALMQSDPKTVGPDLSLTAFERLCLSTGFSGFPVVEGEKLVGIVSRSDVLRSILAERSRAEQITESLDSSLGAGDAEQSLEAIAARVGVRLEGQRVDDVMSHSVVTIEPDRSVQELAALLLEARVHRLPVVEGDRLVGVVTTMDVVRAVAEGVIIEAGSPPAGRRLLEP